MTNMELISVIVPVYNTAKYLRRCVKSILRQTYRDLEIILVDDGSMDASGMICDQLAAEDTRVKVIHQENAGVSAARNAGLEVAKGELIAFADSDDYAHPELIERLYQLLRDSCADISSCEYTSDEAELKCNREATPITFDYVGGINDMLSNCYVTYSACGKLFSKAIVSTLRFRREYSHNEDLLFSYEAFLKSKTIIHTNEKLYLYTVNLDSATRSRFTHKRMTAIDVQEEILNDILNRFPGEELYHTAEQQFLKVNIYMGMQMIKAYYSDSDDFARIKGNIKSRIWKLLTGSLAAGYKVYGLLICILPKMIIRFFLRLREGI